MKKRKWQDEEAADIPWPKQICRCHLQEQRDFSQATSIAETSNFPQSSESHPQSSEASNTFSFHGNEESIMSSANVSKSHSDNEQMECTSNEPSSSSGASSSTRKQADSSYHQNCEEDCGWLGFGLEEDIKLAYECGVLQGNFVDSSEESKESEKEAKGLTIDKEFEQYFSMLMM